jgi:hypothetical protein
MTREYTNHQKKIISRFYDNRDQIDEQRLGELVTSLYLANGEKQKAKLWSSAEDAMTRLKVPKSRIAHVMEKRDPAILAAVVEELQKGILRPEK